MVFSQVKHLVKTTNDIYLKWPMVFNQVQHLVKMTNDISSNATQFATLCIYLLHIHLPIYLTNYLHTHY
jgi:hypothetical protein